MFASLVTIMLIGIALDLRLRARGALDSRPVGHESCADANRTGRNRVRKGDSVVHVKKTVVLAAVVSATVAVAGAGGATSGRSAVPSELTIAYQPRIGYAPLIIIRRQRTLEKRYPNMKVNWRVLASGAAITTGVVSGDIHLGAMGVTPFLVGWAAGVGWKLLTALDDADLWLMTRDRASARSATSAARRSPPRLRPRFGP